MDDSVRHEVKLVREGITFWSLDAYSFIRFSGSDAASWLQSQTTNDVAGLASGHGHAGALLDRHGRLQGHFTLHRWEDEYWMLVETAQVSHLIGQLESHLFIEEVTIENSEGDVDFVAVQGREALGFLTRTLDGATDFANRLLPAHQYACGPLELFGIEVLAFHLSVTGEEGFVFVAEGGQGEDLIENLRSAAQDLTAGKIGSEALHILRIEAGLPRFGLDMDTSNPIPETTLERTCVHYDKGCYLGQEVVARLRTYGSVKQALMGLVIVHEEQAFFPPDTNLYIDGKKAGVLKSTAYSPTLDAPIALAYLGRDHRVPDAVSVFKTKDGRGSFEARIVALPFFETPDPSARARDVYDEALGHFEDDLHDEDATAIPMLKEAILLDPEFEDAYEALGVILNRHHRVDEAIHFMTQLVELNPDCIMAHTNLSVFYVAKGMIEKAEEEKAMAAVLQIQKASDKGRAQEMAEAERARIQQEAEERMGMFQEVLDIDPDDPLATFGLGQAYIQLEKYEEAIPHLQKATEVQKDYSVAFLNLGKCYEFSGQIPEAITAYDEGIKAASRKGDLMPMREMERRAKALRAEQATV